MSYSLFKLINETECTAAQQLIELAVASWADMWISDSSNISEVNVFLASDLNKPFSKGVFEWLTAMLDDNACIGLSTTKGFYGHLKSLLFERTIKNRTFDNSNSNIASRLVTRALNSLIETILAGFEKDYPDITLVNNSEEFQETILRPGSGYLILQIQVLSEALLIALDWRIMEKKLSVETNNKKLKEGHLLPAISALGDYKVDLEVIAGEVEVEFYQLTNIVIGDVLPLNTGINDPMTIKIGGKELSHCYLGKKDGKKVAQIVS